jgi:UDP-2-acetamido-3-amino-2,3-dideoxy-glucuronate N-acetyltransferase
MGELIHPTADVSAGARIGEGTRVWHQAQVREGAIIGSGCVLGKGVYIDVGVIIGANCKLENWVCVYRPAVLEAGVFLGPGVIVTNDRLPRAVNPDGSIKDAEAWSATGATIGRGAAVGAGSVILPGVNLGRWSLVGAGGVVTRDVPDHGLVVGNPARLVGYVCACGARLDGDPSTERRRCHDCGRVMDLR